MADGVTVSELVAVALNVGVVLVDSKADAEADTATVAVVVRDTVDVRDPVGDAESVADTEIVNEREGEADGSAPRDCEIEIEADLEDVMEAAAVTV